MSAPISRSSSENPIPEFESLSLSIDDKKSPQSKTQKVAAKVLVDDSDGELSDSDNEIPVFSRTGGIKAKHMTIKAKKEDGSIFNIKGSELIKIAHEIVKDVHARCKNSETAQANKIDSSVKHIQLDGGLTFPHHEYHLTINNSLGWITSLGHWKEIIPGTEIREGKKLKDVKIGKCVFLIQGERLYYPDPQQGQKDFSYKEIIAILLKSKKNFPQKQNKIDSVIAESQLKFLSKFDSEDSFIHFLNALMFGVESTGLNAGILTSLMTLELIAEGKLTYEEAFLKNSDGGVYPFATFGDNKGTFAKRKSIIEQNRLSMKTYRNDPSHSPIATKEAILIKYWLKSNDIVKKHDSYDTSIQKIRDAFKELMSKYFPIT